MNPYIMILIHPNVPMYYHPTIMILIRPNVPVYYHATRPKDGHAPEIAREMGLSDPSEENPDAGQVADLVRYLPLSLPLYSYY